MEQKDARVSIFLDHQVKTGCGFTISTLQRPPSKPQTYQKHTNNVQRERQTQTQKTT